MLKEMTNPRVIRRFIIIAGISTFALFTVWMVVGQYRAAPLGDFEVRQGDVFLGDEKYDEALERFSAALAITPNHRGALMGRAVAYMQTGLIVEAEAELTYLIDFLVRTLTDDDTTGIGVLAAAYSNRALIYDRKACASGDEALVTKAVEDYIRALKVDAETVDGPGWVDKILYGTTKPGTALDRAKYLMKQLDLPKDERVLCIPEKDAEQRMYKP